MEANVRELDDPYHNPRGSFVRFNSDRIPNKILDIPYDTLSEDQKLDIYLPENAAGKIPVVVYIHGGGFEMGDRKYGHIHKLIEGLDRGYAVVSASYRLSKEKVFPAAVQDVRNAVRFLRRHADEYGLDADRMGLFGESAGGNLAAVLAMDPQEPIFDAHIPEGLKGVSASVAACVDWFGVTDMNVMMEQNIQNNLRPPKFTKDNCPESRYFGRSLSELPEDWINKANPITYVSERMCPMLIEHGTGDFQVPVQQSQMLYHAITEKVDTERAELFMLEGAIHEDSRFERDENMAIVWKFFENRLRK